MAMAGKGRQHSVFANPLKNKWAHYKPSTFFLPWHLNRESSIIFFGPQLSSRTIVEPFRPSKESCNRFHGLLLIQKLTQIISFPINLYTIH